MAGGIGMEDVRWWQLPGRIYHSAMKGWRKYRKPQIDYSDVIMPWTIIQHNLSIKDYEKRVKDFHGTFKYKFLLPIVWLAHWLMQRCLMPKSKIPDEGQNLIIRAWIDNFDVTLQEWCLIYRKMDITDAEKTYLKNASTDILRKMNDLLVSGYMHDGAYRIFFDMLLLNMSIKIGELYPDKIGHFIYNSKHIDDYDYKVVTGKNGDHLIFTTQDKRWVVKKGDAILVETLDMKSLKEAQKRELSNENIQKPSG